jgi:hypothetical protein
MLLDVILNTGLFQLEYTKWHALPDNERTIVNAWNWWAKKVQIRMKFSRVAGGMGRANEYEQRMVPLGQNQGKLEEVIEEFANMTQEVLELKQELASQAQIIEQLQQQMALNI